MALQFQPYPVPQEPQQAPNQGLQVLDRVAQMAQLFHQYKAQQQASEMAKQKQMVDLASAASDRGEDFWTEFARVGGKAPAGMAAPVAGAVPGAAPTAAPSVPAGMGPVAGTNSPGLVAGESGQATAPDPAAAPKGLTSALEITPEYLAEIRKKKGSKGLKEFQDSQSFLTNQKQANSQMDNLAITNESKIRDDYSKASGTFKTVSENIGVIQSIANRPQTPASDISLIFSYMKLVDPGSTVKEQEAATAANAAGIPERIRTAYNNALRGEKLGPTQRADFIRTSGDIYQGWVDKQNQLDEDFRGIATRSRVNPENVMLRYGVPNFNREALSKAAGAQNMAPAPGLPQPKPVQNTQAQIQAAEAWLAANPNDPKASAIRTRVQSMRMGDVTRG